MARIVGQVIIESEGVMEVRFADRALPALLRDKRFEFKPNGIAGHMGSLNLSSVPVVLKEPKTKVAKKDKKK